MEHEDVSSTKAGFYAHPMYRELCIELKGPLGSTMKLALELLFSGHHESFAEVEDLEL